MDIKVLGSGCANCKRTFTIMNEAVQELHADATVSEVHDLAAIMGYGVMSTPAIVIDERVVSTGKVPAKSQAVALIRNAQAR